MTWGLQNRLSRIIRPTDGHTVMLAADHGYFRGPTHKLEKRDARYLGLACRIASEFGAHFVKTYYCEDFSKVVESCPVPLVVAGGPKLEKELDVLELAYDAIQDGAKGVDMGRNIWQSTNPVGMIRAIRAVVHDRATPKEALDLVKGGAKPKK